MPHACPRAILRIAYLTQPLSRYRIRSSTVVHRCPYALGAPLPPVCTQCGLLEHIVWCVCVLQAGLLAGHCCREMSLIQRGLTRQRVGGSVRGAAARSAAAAATGEGNGGDSGAVSARGSSSGRSSSGGGGDRGGDRGGDGNGGNLATDFFAHQQRNLPLGFEDPLRKWHQMILASQAPHQCQQLCQCVHVRGAFFSNIRGIAACVMAAALQGCALVEEDVTARPALANFVTSPAMRRVCREGNRSLAFHCYFKPLSNCSRLKASAVAESWSKRACRLDLMPSTFLSTHFAMIVPHARLASIGARLFPTCTISTARCRGLTSCFSALSGALALNRSSSSSHQLLGGCGHMPLPILCRYASRSAHTHTHTFPCA